MIKIVEIISAKNFQLVCKFNTQEIKTIAIKPLLDNQKHLNGIEKLYDKNNFEKAQIGLVGEVFWKDIITTQHQILHQVWNYDISPEYAYKIGK
ncbi:MAG: hypothetical protein EAZ15_09700 [Sphingobacteriales bacterium]|nr:MAG: hypothetical protein EAZ15_09700 [Sphingobacteriales bacterium]